MNAAAGAAAVRRGAGWFEQDDRGLLVVRGGDRVRWTDGMISGDVTALAPGPDRSGCEALLLTAKGRIVCDLHALRWPEEIWLEIAGAARRGVLEHLQRFIIADDVRVDDESEAWRRFALEGPAAPELLEAVAGRAPGLATNCGELIELAGARVVAWAWGWSGEQAFQLFVPGDAAAAVREAFEAAADAASRPFQVGDAATLEVLRIEAGRPRLGAELGPDVLPAEAGLVERAVSLDKGCYTGQEIVARMASRGAAGHSLVGLRFDVDAPPAPGAPICVDGKPVGELTSSAVSAQAGAIGLGFVRRAHSAAGGRVAVGEGSAEIVPLPFVSPSA